MQHWPLAPPVSRSSVGAGVGGGLGKDAGALLGCIAHLGGPAFAEHTLASLHGAGLVVGSWSVYRVWADRQPCLHLSASAGFADTTRDCFRVYADGLYRADRSFEAVAAGTQGLLRMHADEVPNADHREAIYRRHRVLERASLATRDGDGSVFAVNLYRHENQGRFGDAELGALAAQGPLLLALVQRHVALTEMQRHVALTSPAALAQTPRSPRQRLLARCATLTGRELDICERLLKGWTHDGIAADLGLSVATVKTYRARAFARLGLHFRSELFAAFAAAP